MANQSASTAVRRWFCKPTRGRDSLEQQTLNEIRQRLQHPQRALKIGYLMQADAVDMSTVSGPRHHVEAVFEGFRKRGHVVRMVAVQDHQILWTDDLITWLPAKFSLSESGIFRLLERGIRGIQSRLRLPFFRFFDSFRFSDACTSLLSDFDILYQRDGTISYGGLIAARRLGIPLVLEVNGDLIEEWTFLGVKFPGLQGAVVRILTRQIYRHIPMIVAVGETLRQRLIQRWGLDPSRIQVVTNGVDVEFFQKASRLDPLSGLFPPENEYLIFVGGFQPWHGVELILEAFCRIVTEKPQAKLVLVGDGPMLQVVRDQAATLQLADAVIFTGTVDRNEVAALLALASVAVIYHRASAAEIVETPLKLFEYMAAGKAIVAPAVPNMMKIVTDRENALLVPPDNPVALATACLELLKDQVTRDNLGAAARNEALDKHSWDRAVCELEDIFFRLLDPPQVLGRAVDGVH